MTQLQYLDGWDLEVSIYIFLMGEFYHLKVNWSSGMILA